MIDPVQLAAVVAQGQERALYRIPLAQDVQALVTEQWDEQFTALVKDTEKFDFDPAYTPEPGELFQVKDFAPPEWLSKHASGTVATLAPLASHEDEFDRVRGIAAFTKLGAKEVVLFQNFARSHILRPGFSLFLERGSYTSIERPGLTLNDRLAGALYAKDGVLVFASFRAMNVIVPLGDLYREASEEEIREVLAHPQLAPENVDAVAEDASQWFQKRFALLKDSDVLTKFTPKQIQSRSKKYNVTVRLEKGKLVFPADKTEAKRLLQFLNEELFRGAITERLFSTNSKRAEE